MEWRYTGKEITKEITYILEGGQYGLGIDYCILGLKPTGIELKNIDLKDITMEEQVAKINEEDEEFAVAIINYDLDNAIEEFYDCMQARLGLLEYLGVDAEDVMKAYPEHLEKLKNRPRKED